MYNVLSYVHHRKERKYTDLEFRQCLNVMAKNIYKLKFSVTVLNSVSLHS